MTLARIRRARSALALVLVASAASAEPARWTLVEKDSRLLFSVQVMGSDFAGRFDKFSADISFSPDDPGSGRIDVSVDMAAASTGMGEADAALPTPTWFDVEQHANARFVAQDFVATADGFEGDAVLTVKGTAFALRFPFAWTQADGADGRARLESAVLLDRRTFALGADEFDDEDTVGFEVNVHVDAHLEQAD